MVGWADNAGVDWPACTQLFKHEASSAAESDSASQSALEPMLSSDEAGEGAT